MKLFNTITLVAIATILTSCTNEEISCSSDSARDLVSDLIKEGFLKDSTFPTGFNIDKSEYALSVIRTIDEMNNGYKCRAKLDITFELKDYVKEIKKNDPDKYKSMYRNYDYTHAETSLDYTIEETDDNQIYVELQQ